MSGLAKTKWMPRHKNKIKNKEDVGTEQKTKKFDKRRVPLFELRSAEPIINQGYL